MSKFRIVIFSLLVGIFLATNAYALNAPAMQGGNPDNWYIEVEWNNDSGGAVQRPTHGMLMEWDLDAATGETRGVTVHMSDTADTIIAAGVVPSYDDTAHNLGTRTLQDGDTFLLQIKGVHTAVAADGNITAGGSLGTEVNGALGDGDGQGFAFAADAVNTSSNESHTGIWAPVYLNIGQFTQ